MATLLFNSITRSPPGSYQHTRSMVVVCHQLWLWLQLDMVTFTSSSRVFFFIYAIISRQLIKDSSSDPNMPPFLIEVTDIESRECAISFSKYRLIIMCWSGSRLFQPHQWWFYSVLASILQSPNHTSFILTPDLGYDKLFISVLSQDCPEYCWPFSFYVNFRISLPITRTSK